MTGPAYRYAAVVEAPAHDGDTLTCRVDLGFHITIRVSCRLAGINARELGTPGGREARDHLRSLCPPGTPVTLASLGLDKYGRALAHLTLPDGGDLADRMITHGYAAAWDGTGVRPVPSWPPLT